MTNTYVCKKCGKTLSWTTAETPCCCCETIADSGQERFEAFRTSMIAFVDRNRNTYMSSMDLVDCILVGYIDYLQGEKE